MSLSKSNNCESACRKSTRILGFDMAKTIAMFLVVLLHASFYAGIVRDSFVSRVMMSFTVICVPLFIAVNGAILLNKPLNFKKHLNKIFGIVFLLLIWRLIHIVIYSFFGAPRLSLSQFCSILLGNTSVDGYLMGHFWFLEALVSIYVVFPLIKLAYDYKDQKPLLLMLISLFLFTFGIDCFRCVFEALFGGVGTTFSDLIKPISNFNIFGSFGYLLVYFISGGFLGRFWKDKGKDYFYRKCPIALILLAVSIFCTSLIHEIQYTNGIAGPFSTPYGYWLPSTFFATFAVLYLCLIIGERCHSRFLVKPLMFFGSNTLGVYFLHMFGLVFMAHCLSSNKAVLTFGFSNIENFAYFLVIILILFSLLTFLTAFLKRLPLINRLFSF